MDDNDQMKDDLIEMKASSKIKMEFDSVQLNGFWWAQLNTFPQLPKKALEILVPFATTCGDLELSVKDKVYSGFYLLKPYYNLKQKDTLL